MSAPDRELLELAAKAAGLSVSRHMNERISPSLMFVLNGSNWNPLTDDGDALRLAVKLNLSVTPYPIFEVAKHSVVAELKRHAECPRASEWPIRYCVKCSDPCQRRKQIAEVVPCNGDPCAATRRAIVCAAAAIAKAEGVAA